MKTTTMFLLGATTLEVGTEVLVRDARDPYAPGRCEVRRLAKPDTFRARVVRIERDQRRLTADMVVDGCSAAHRAILEAI